MNTILFFILLFLLVATLPMWSYSQEWSYYPSAGLGLLLLTLITVLSISHRK